MNNSQNPSTILITGASSGIGKALADFYAQPGRTLLLTGRNEPRLNAVAAACRQKGALVHIGLFDIRDKDAVRNWITKYENDTPIDLAIANAGVSGGTGGSPEGEPYQQSREIFDINLTGVINTVEAVLPAMIKRRSGQIALMSSLAGFRGFAGAPAYSASKAGVRVYGEGLRGTYKPLGIKINVICPGFIRTPMTAVNPYSMPFMLDVDKAASLIAFQLSKNVGRIAFPLPTYLLAGFLGLLPDFVAQKIMVLLPSKPKKN